MATTTTKTKLVRMPAADKACAKHPAFEKSNCPSCGTAREIGKAPAAPAKKAKVTRSLPEGFTLGMKVKSSRDGLTYEVIGADRSPLYVVLRSAEGKRVVRAIKTLTVVPTRKRAAAKKA
jgi:hypothetical protein